MVLTLTGLFLGFVGSIVLAFSLNPIIQTLKTATSAQEIYIETSNSPSDTILFSGFGKQLESSAKESRIRLLIGSVLIASAFFTQAISFLCY